MLLGITITFTLGRFMQKFQVQSLLWLLKNGIFQGITVSWSCALRTKFYQLGCYL